MADTPPIAPVSLNDEGPITVDLQCVSCGYNLRGLSPDRMCPECGVPVGRSRYGNLLQYSNPDWIEQLASGMKWLVAGIVLSLSAVIVAILLVMIFRSLVATRRTGRPTLTLVRLLISVVNLIGCWKLTTPDPAATVEGITARQLVRVLLIGGLAAGLVNDGLQTIHPLVAWGVSLVAAVMGDAEHFAAFTYARQLASRIPDLTLASSTKVVMWGLGICNVFGTVEMLIAGPTGTPAGPFASGVFDCGLGIGMLVFGIWSLRLIRRYQGAFNDAACRARTGWAKAGPASIPR